MVGCIIVKNDKIIAEGYHRLYGGVHAEIDALANGADQDLIKGSTLYVNLEPCNHFGKTPPCTNALIKAGVSRVVISNKDPNPMVAGRGIHFLRTNGVQVVEDILADEGAELNRRFFTFHQKKRPYVLLKWAQSSDGFISPLNKKQTSPHWISNEISRNLVHKWRGEEQSILVGRNTVLMDDPALTCRIAGGKNPIRIILDSKLKLSTAHKVFKEPGETVIINTMKDAVQGRLRYVKIRSSTAKYVLSKLYELNILSVLVEGGAETLQQFINENLWDECRIFTGSELMRQGVASPTFKQQTSESIEFGSDLLQVFRNTTSA